MAAVTIYSDFGAQKNKKMSITVSIVSPFICCEVIWQYCHRYLENIYVFTPFSIKLSSNSESNRIIPFTSGFYANPRHNLHLPKPPWIHSTIHHSYSVLRLLEQMVVPKSNRNPWLMGGSISPNITGIVSISITFAIQHLSDNKSLLCQ